MADRSSRPILAAESVTALGKEVRGAVLVAGSHGGIIACYLGASAGAHALILNDAGCGRDNAGVAGLEWLEAIGMAAATVSHDSARIGDGLDALARGVISHANRPARAVGVAPDMRASEAAERLRLAATPFAKPTPYAEGRWHVADAGGAQVWALDSVGKLVREDAGRILIIGSHGALHGGRPETALNLHDAPVAARAAVFHDAGGGCERAGITRLAELDRRGIAAATVAHSSARIGDGRSMWQDGVLSHVGEVAMACGWRARMRLRDLILTAL
ncbi:MAG: hypothetical protein JNM79_00685 [Burkholderiales bacterium]|nr:hypothetical protein [Burkholderiales bacterium]